MLSEHTAHASVNPLPSNRSFGFLFFCVFLLVGAWPYSKPLVACARGWDGSAETCLASLEGISPHPWALGVSGVFLLLALIYPRALSPLNRGWMAFGNVLHGVVSFLVLGILFYLVITPMGLAMRLGKRDALALKLDRSASSYWISRNPPGPEPQTLSNQF